jgi:penicillin-binding protein 1B
LGTTEATPLQMAAAYASFANGGRKTTARAISTDSAESEDQIIAPTTAFMITDMLQGVIDHGTARAARNQFPRTAIAGKTGTSRDGWFVGYSPNLVCAIWIGFDDNKQLGLTGAEAALPAWVEFMKAAIDLRPELGGNSFDQPEGITIANVDPETDELASAKCPMHQQVAILMSQAPKSECFRHGFYFNQDDQEVPQTIAASDSPRIRAKPNKPAPSRWYGLRDTQVDTNKQGRTVLVNEMRIGER